jgi:hypothetical protein
MANHQEKPSVLAVIACGGIAGAGVGIPLGILFAQFIATEKGGAAWEQGGFILAPIGGALLGTVYGLFWLPKYQAVVGTFGGAMLGTITWVVFITLVLGIASGSGPNPDQGRLGGAIAGGVSFALLGIALTVLLRSALSQSSSTVSFGPAKNEKDLGKKKGSFGSG